MLERPHPHSRKLSQNHATIWEIDLKHWMTSRTSNFTFKFSYWVNQLVGFVPTGKLESFLHVKHWQGMSQTGCASHKFTYHLCSAKLWWRPTRSWHFYHDTPFSFPWFWNHLPYTLCAGWIGIRKPTPQLPPRPRSMHVQTKSLWYCWPESSHSWSMSIRLVCYEVGGAEVGIANSLYLYSRGQGWHDLKQEPSQFSFQGRRGNLGTWMIITKDNKLDIRQMGRMLLSKVCPHYSNEIRHVSEQNIFNNKHYQSDSIMV